MTRWFGYFLPPALCLAAWCVASLSAAEVAQVSSAGKPTASPTAPAEATKPAKGKDRDKDGVGMPPEREAAVLAFVGQHHGELSELLALLKSSRPKEYQQALRELYRVSERLGNLYDHDRQRYDLDLAAWKAQSRIQLLAARLKMQPNDKQRDERRAELKAVLVKQQEVQLQILELERQRVTDRAAKLDAQIARLKADREAALNRQIDALLGQGKKPNKVKPTVNETPSK